MTTSIQDALLKSTDRELQAQSGGFVISHKPHAGQLPLLQSNARFRVIAAHRRWGKNWVCIFDAMRRMRRLAEEAEREQLSPRVVVWFVFPTYILADELWQDLKRMIPAAWIERTLESKPMRMELRGDIHISIRSAENPEHLVGAGVDLLYMIEAARIKEGAWEAVRPTLTSSGRAGLAVFNSTPKGQNWFARIWDRCEDPEETDWEGWRVPAFLDDLETRHPLSVVPNTERILAERAENRQSWWNQEYMAQFVAGEGQVFQDVRSRIGRPPEEPQRVVMGVDLAKRTDYTVFSAFEESGRQVSIERMHGISYPQQGERLVGTIARLGARRCVVEANGPGDAFIDQLRGQLYEAGVSCRIIEMMTTAQTKSAMINALALAFERGEVTLVDNPVQTAEFEAYEATKTPSGNETYGAPEGQHDDTVMGAALAWTQITGRGKARKGKYPRPGQLSGLRKRSYAEQRDGRPMERRFSVRSQSARLKGIRIVRSRYDG